jgi:predicted RNA-binding protein YlqC (UPF0109 family)
MVLGIYYLTQERPGAKGEGMFFKSVNEAILAYENNVITLHSIITVRMTKTLEDGTTSVNVNVADADLGRVIGKGGKIATSIRTIVYAAASKENEKVKVNINND